MKSSSPLQVQAIHSKVQSFNLYGRELLDQASPGGLSELWVNGSPLPLRSHRDPHDPSRELLHLKGERFVNQFAGWSLVIAREMGERAGLKHPCFGVQTLLRREPCDQTCPCPGPGGPVIEAPLYVDTLGILNWNWQFWGDDTRMIFPSSHGSGPTDEFGHAGHEHDTPEVVKKYLQNIWRRIYPGCLVIHGGLFYDAVSHNWLALTCRRPTVGYHLNIENAGRGIGYDFTLHAPLNLNDVIRLPEIKIYYGPDHDSMMRWLADYVGHYYEPTPEWVGKRVFGGQLSWNNQPTWSQQADHWEREIADQQYNAIGYSLVTNRPIKSGTTPLGYEPDPNHGTKAEFAAMCHRLADKDVPLLIWMSHSGLAYQGGDEIDDDWFIRGIDGNICAAWGNRDGPELAHINPGHPGYIEFTKKWIRFYIGECRCKGIFLDCLSWAFPPDFKPRSFMRYPGDTNRMAIRFIDEIYAEIKRCDPEAILLGEGATLDAPVNVIAINTNPRRAIDGMGPRDFFLSLNHWTDRRFAIDQGPPLAPASGYCRALSGSEHHETNRRVVSMMRQHGASAFLPLPGDLSILKQPEDDLLIVPGASPDELRSVHLPEPWSKARRLESTLDPAVVRKPDSRSAFTDLPPGIYRIVKA